MYNSTGPWPTSVRDIIAQQPLIENIKTLTHNSDSLIKILKTSHTKSDPLTKHLKTSHTTCDEKQGTLSRMLLTPKNLSRNM